jgi:hypothetical protein
MMAERCAVRARYVPLLIFQTFGEKLQKPPPAPTLILLQLHVDVPQPENLNLYAVRPIRKDHHQ